MLMGYINKQTMGASYVYPQYLNSEQAFTIKQANSPNTCPSQTIYRQEQEQKQIQPLHIPCFTIRQSPFKSQSQRQQNFIIQKQKQLRVQVLVTKNDQIVLLEQQNGQLAVKKIIWSQVLYDNRLLFRILDFLPCSDTSNFAHCNKRLSSLFYFYQLFHLPNNWAYTQYHVQQKILTQNRFSFRRIVNQFSYEESQHSLDLDRLQSLFMSQQDLNDQITRFDRIMRAINAKGVSYFQGLNSIIIVLISMFQDEFVYEIALKLLQKTNNIQNQPTNYNELIQKIQKEVKEKSLKLYKKFQQLDFNIEYFAMKWILGLFSTDLKRNVLMHLWDLIINFGIAALKWFIVSLFIYIEELILDISDPDEINHKLKNLLKDYIVGDEAFKIFQRTRIMMCNQLYGEGCSDIFRPWNGYTEQQKTFTNNSPKILQLKQNRNIFGIIAELDNEQQNQNIEQQVQPLHINQNVIEQFCLDQPKLQIQIQNSQQICEQMTSQDIQIQNPQKEPITNRQIPVQNN